MEEEEEEGGENFDGEENAADQGSLRGNLSAAGDTMAGSSGVLAANSFTSQHSTLTDAASGISFWHFSIKFEYELCQISKGEKKHYQIGENWVGTLS